MGQVLCSAVILSLLDINVSESELLMKILLLWCVLLWYWITG